MSVSLPVELTGAREAAETAARDIASVFNKFGVGICRDFGGAIGRGIAAFDTGPAVRQLEALEGAYRRTAAAEADSAARMMRLNRDVEVAQLRRVEIADRITRAERALADAHNTSYASQAAAVAAVERAESKLADARIRYSDSSSAAIKANSDIAGAQAMSERASRDYTDALVANEGAHRSWQRATADSAAGASALGRTFNAVGVGSVAALGVAFVETTKKAGDFQQS